MGKGQNSSMSAGDDYLKRILEFLEEIGIVYYMTDEHFDSFLKGIKIEKGKLSINPEELLCVGDILHEAGHLALVPSNLRHQANNHIGESLGEEYTYEMGVILWSVAAAQHLAIPLTEIFHQKGYKGDAQWLMEQFESGNYIGLPLLKWMGLVAYDEEKKDNIDTFPKMIRWTRA